MGLQRTREWHSVSTQRVCRRARYFDCREAPVHIDDTPSIIGGQLLGEHNSFEQTECRIRCHVCWSMIMGWRGNDVANVASYRVGCWKHREVVQQEYIWKKRKEKKSLRKHYVMLG
jgi:hypothetical protein